MLNFAIVTVGDGRVDPADLDLLDRHADSSLTFVPTHRHRWSSRSGRTVLVAWSCSPRTIPTSGAWGSGVLAAYARRSSPGPTASPGSDWLARIQPSNGPLRVPERTLEVAVGAIANDDDRAIAFSDHLGTGSLFTSKSGRTTIVSDRAGVAAALLVSPQRSPLSVSWMVNWFSSLDDSTGYRGVQHVEPGAEMRWNGERWRLHRRDPEWFDQPETSLDDPLLGPMLDAAAEELVSAVRNLPEGVPIQVGLTGGRDSRLVLAAVLASGRSNVTAFTMQGSEQPNADGLVAAGLARATGVAHAVRGGAARTPMSPDVYLERLKCHVFRSEAALPAAELRWQADESAEIVLDGTGGELFRAKFDDSHAVNSTAEAVELIMRRMAGRNSILRPSVIEHQYDVIRSMLEEFAVTVPASDLVHRMYFEIFTRRWIGADEALNGFRPQVRLLRNRQALCASRAVGWHGRRIEYIHLSLWHRLRPDLARLAFASAPLGPAANAMFGPGHATEAVVRNYDWGSPKGVTWDTLRDGCRRQIGTGESAVDEFVDRSRLDELLAQPVVTDQRLLRQVQGVTAAAIWLTGSEDRSARNIGTTSFS